jgi:hypothetical protein
MATPCLLDHKEFGSTTNRRQDAAAFGGGCGSSLMNKLKRLHFEYDQMRNTIKKCKFHFENRDKPP